MSKESNNFENDVETEFGDLRKRYQSVRAPANLAGRIRAHLKDREGNPHRWQPAFAAIPVAIALFAIVPFIMRQESTTPASLQLPSLATLSRLAPSKPTTVSPSLSRIRTVRAPPMPARPAMRRANDPQTNYEENKLHKFEENDYEYV